MKIPARACKLPTGFVVMVMMNEGNGIRTGTRARTCAARTRRREVGRVPVDDVDPAVVIAMRVVHIMQVAIDKIVVVIIMRHELVTARVVVRMCRVAHKRFAVYMFCARVGVRLTQANLVIVDMVLMRIMQMSIMQIVNVVFVRDSRVPAPCAVNMRVVPLVDFVRSLVLF